MDRQHRDFSGLRRHAKVHSFRIITAVLAWVFVEVAFYYRPDWGLPRRRSMPARTKPGSGVYHACFGKSGIDLGHALIRDDVWMLGHRPIRQVLDGVDVVFFYESPAHVGPNLAGYREGSTSGHTFHHVN